MSKPFLRNTSEISLLENETGQSLRIISSNLTPYVMNNNNDYLNRCISTVPNGKDELRKRTRIGTLPRQKNHPSLVLRERGFYLHVR